MNTTASRWRPGVAWVAVLSVIEVIAVSADAGPPLQPFLSVVFVLTCPGFLLLDLENPKDPAARAILGIGASIAVNVTVVTVALVGDIRRVAPVLLAVLVVLALMPRPVLRRGFARVRALAQGTDVREPDATVLAEDLGAPTPVEVNVAAASADKYPTAPEVATATLPDLEDTVPAAASVPWQQEPSALASDGDLAGLVDEDLTSEEEQLVAPVDQDETSETDDHEPVTESAHDDDDTESDDEDITQQHDEDPEGLTEPDDEDITQQRDEYPEGLTEPDDEDITQQRDEYPEGLTESDDEDGATQPLDDTEPDDEDITQQHDEDPEGLTEPDDEDGATQPLDDTEPTQQDQEAAALDEPTPAIIIEGSQGMEEVDLTPPATEDSVQSAVVADPAESSSAIELAAKQLSAELAEALGEADDISQPVDDEDDTAPLDGDASEPSAVDTPITELANEEITEPAVDETDIEAVEAEGPAPVLEDDSGAEQVGDEAEEWPEAEIVPAATDQDTSEQRIDEIEEQTKPPAEVTAPPPAVAAPILVFGVDINEADAGAFADFPGIGPRLARLIVAYRDKRGPFGSPGELLNLLRAYEANQKDRTQ